MMDVVPQPPKTEPASFFALMLSEDEPQGDGALVPGEPVSMRSVLQVINSIHESISKQLKTIDQRMQRVEAHMVDQTSLSRKKSITSNTSQTPKVSTSYKKIVASMGPAARERPQENLAMEALQMDIASLVPIHQSKRRQTKAGSSMSLSGFSKGKERKNSKDSPSSSPDGSRNLSPSCKQPVEPPALPSTRMGPVGSKHLELPVVKQPLEASDGASSLEVVAKVSIDVHEDSVAMDQMPTAQKSSSLQQVTPSLSGSALVTPSVSAKPARVGSAKSLQSSNEHHDNQRCSSLHSSCRENSMKHEQSSGRESSMKRENSKPVASVASRRSSLQLNRAVSKANITEVFKLREAELTAELRTPGPSSPKSQKRAPSAGSAAQLEEIPPLNSIPHSETDTSESEREEVAKDAKVERVMDPESEEEEFEETKSLWLKLSPLNTFITCHVSRALGIMPLFDQTSTAHHTWTSFLKSLMNMVYHWSLVCALLFFLVQVVNALSLCHLYALDDGLAYEGEAVEVCLAAWPPLAVDMVLLSGGILVLVSWGGFFQYTDTTKLVAQSAQDLSSYCEQNGLSELWKSWSCKDALSTLLLWFLLLGLRYGVSLWHLAAQGYDLRDANDMPFRVPHAVNGVVMGILVVASFWQVRTSHAMLLILNWWSAALLTNQVTCADAKRQWRRVSGLFRKTSRTFEFCFAALASMILMLALASLYDLRQGRAVELVFGAAAVLFVIPGILWTHARTTTACKRLPSLVTLCEAENEEDDDELMGLAMYLSLSECGFFVWDTCVTVAFVQKFLYFATALSGTIGFQTGALQLG